MSAANIPSACRTAIITINDAMILSYDATPGRMEFSERTGQINMRKVDGWQTLATKPIDQPIDLAA